jgi:hypothetical protein
MKVILVFSLFIFGLAACSTEQKKEIHDDGKQVGSAVSEAARETGHFFRDTSQEIFGGGSDSGNDKEKSKK